jgi:hypothetical protein
MHDKNLKRFRISLRDLHPSLDASVSIIRRQYPTNVQRATRVILHKIEVFDKRYADLLANMEEYTRAFVKNYNSTGQIIHLPLDSASTIVHLYRSTIASRYNLTLQTLLSSDDDEESSSPANVIDIITIKQVSLICHVEKLLSITNKILHHHWTVQYHLKQHMLYHQQIMIHPITRK